MDQQKTRIARRPRTYKCLHTRCRTLVLTRYLRQADSAIVLLMDTNDGSAPLPCDSEGEAAREPGERVARGSDGEADREPDGATAQGQGELVAQAPGATLIEVFPEIALIVGESLSALPDEVTSDLVELPFGVDHVELDKVLGTAGVLAQTASAAAAVGNLQGLVRLTPDTVAAMNGGLKPLVSGGDNLGVLTNAGGRFARQVRWKPVGPQAAGGTVLASLGPAFMMVALQLQLGRLEKTAKKSYEISHEILGELRKSQQDELAGLAAAVGKALKSAMRSGHVTDTMWSRVGSYSNKIEEHRNRYGDKVEAHSKKIRELRGASASELYSYIKENGGRVLGDLKCCMVVERVNRDYQILLAAHVCEKARTDPGERENLKTIIEDVQGDYEAAVVRMTGLVDSLSRSLHLARAVTVAQSASIFDNAVSGLNAVKGWLPGDWQKSPVPRDQVLEAVEELVNGVEEFASAIALASPRRPEPRARVMGEHPDKEAEALLEVLRWTLRGDEELVGFAHATDARQQTVIAITGQRVVEAKLADLRSRGEIWREIPNDEIRYIRRRGGNEGRAELDVITKEENLTWSFGPADESDQAGLDAITGMLAERMRLPEEEMRELTGSRSDGAPRIGAPAPPPLPEGGHSGQSDSK